MVQYGRTRIPIIQVSLGIFSLKTSNTWLNFNVFRVVGREKGVSVRTLLDSDS